MSPQLQLQLRQAACSTCQAAAAADADAAVVLMLVLMLLLLPGRFRVILMADNANGAMLTPRSDGPTWATVIASPPPPSSCNPR
jgi:hypothetical protein